MNQTLFPVKETAKARRSDPSTSHEAAARVDVTQTQSKVLAVLISGPATDHEIYERVLDLYGPIATPQSIRSRRSELVNKRKVIFDGTYGTTENGNKSRKWRLA